MNPILRSAIASAVGGFLAFLIIEQFQKARDAGVIERLTERLRVAEGNTVFNATQTETILQ